MKPFRLFFGLFFAVLSSLPAPAGYAQSVKPNIILILADDLGWNGVASYGNPYYETPHLDRLARQGMRFLNAYTSSPVCSPTRAAILTGKHPARLHLTEFIPGEEPPEGSPLGHPDWQKFLPLPETTIAEALKAEGYATALFGKWHLSPEKTPPVSLPYNPDKQGFDESFVTYKPSPELAQPWQEAENDAHNVRLITEKSIDFIQRHRDRPFFLFVSHNTVHAPLMERQARIEAYRQKPGSERPENNPVLAAMMHTLDESVGALVGALDAAGLSERTLVVFYSDNGGLEATADQRPFRSGKANLYEGGIRAPLIVRRPGFVPAASLSEAPATSTDLFPTFLEAAGSSIPAPTDGISLLPAFRGEVPAENRAVFWHYPHYHHSGSGPSAAVRLGDYKLIEWYERSLCGRPGPVELYDLRRDPAETTDLSADEPARVEELRRLLAGWRAEIGAQMPPAAAGCSP